MKNLHIPEKQLICVVCVGKRLYPTIIHNVMFKVPNRDPLYIRRVEDPSPNVQVAKLVAHPDQSGKSVDPVACEGQRDQKSHQRRNCCSQDDLLKIEGSAGSKRLEKIDARWPLMQEPSFKKRVAEVADQSEHQRIKRQPSRRPVARRNDLFDQQRSYNAGQEKQCKAETYFCGIHSRGSVLFLRRWVACETLRSTDSSLPRRRDFLP